MTSWPQNQVRSGINSGTSQSTGLASKHHADQLQLLTNYWNSFPLWQALCPAKPVPTFDIKQVLTSHCEEGCLQRSMGCSHCLMHTKQAILGGLVGIISYVVSKGGALIGVVSDYWSAEPRSTSMSRWSIKPCYDFISWEDSGCIIPSS